VRRRRAAIAETLAEHPEIERVSMVCFGTEAYLAYSVALVTSTAG
jgi:hypothetical protein